MKQSSEKKKKTTSFLFSMEKTTKPQIGAMEVKYT